MDHWGGDSGKLEEARAKLIAILEKNRDYAPAYVGMARYEFHSGYIGGDRYDTTAMNRAWKFVQHALKLDPNLFDAHYTASMISRAQGQLDSAREELDRAEAIQPKDAKVKLGRAGLAKAEGRASDVVRLSKEVIAESDNAFDKSVALGYLQAEYWRAGDLDQADAAYRQQLEIDPDSAWAHGNYARFLLERDDLDGAIREGERALRIMRFPFGMQTLAMAYVRKADRAWNEKNFVESANCVEKVAALAEGDASMWSAVGAMLERAARRANDASLRQRAIKAYQRAVELDPNMEPARKALARLTAE